MIRLVRSLLRVHSPSRGLMGTCRCRPCTKGRAERIMRGEPATLADAMVRAVAPIIPPRTAFAAEQLAALEREARHTCITTGTARCPACREETR